MLISSLGQTLLSRDRVLALCDELDILVNYEKLHLVPSLEAVYPKMKLDSVTLKAFLTQAQIQTLLRDWRSSHPITSNLLSSGDVCWVACL